MTRTFTRPLALVLCGAAALFGTSGAGAGTEPPASTPVSARDASTILVKFRNAAAGDAVVARHGDRHLATTATGVHVVKLAPGASVAREVAWYASRASVVYAEPNYIARSSLAAPNDPNYASDWGMEKVRAADGWTAYPGTYSSTGGVPIAIVDTGVQSTHPDLSGRVQTSSGADCTGAASTCIAGGAADDNGHGTHVAGIAGASTNNGVGVAGVAFSSPLIPVKVLNASGSGTYASITNGIVWAVQRGAKVINMSLGGTGYSQALCDAVSSAVGSGVMVVAAAGNSGNAVPSYPAACPGVVGVAATDSSDGSPAYPTSARPMSSCRHRARASTRPTTTARTRLSPAPRWRRRSSRASRLSC
jgi:thermitase